MFDGGSGQTLRQREERLRTLLPARMRSQSGWSDACILNISSGGLLVYSPGEATIGSSVEIRRGANLIIAHVVWRRNQRIGLCSHGRVPIHHLLDNDSVAAAVTSDVAVQAERRKQPRSSDKSRLQARAMEFVGTLFVGITLAVAAAAAVADVISTPISVVTAALAAH